jgi:hypothetical protein
MPDYSFTAERVLSPRELVHPINVGIAPPSPGIYAWWFKKAALDVPEADYQQVDGYELLYTGISPRKPSSTGKVSSGNIKSRLDAHANGDASRSTLRRTLGVLLAEQLGLTLGVHKTREHYGDGERLITRWLRDNAKVAWVVDPMPWEAEDELLEHAVLALNIDGRTDTFAKSISDRRRLALAAARAAG